MCLVLVSGQFLGQYDNSYRFGYDSLSDDFSGSSFGGGANSLGALGNGFASGLASIRDPRQNRGKIDFNKFFVNLPFYEAICNTLQSNCFCCCRFFSSFSSNHISSMKTSYIFGSF